MNKKLHKSIGRLSLFLSFIFLSGALKAQSISYYIADTSTLNPAIPSPEEFLGYSIGTHFTRHDRIVAYFKELEKHSDRITVETIGKTYEERPLIIATISDPENHGNLENIKSEHKKLVDPTEDLISTAD